MFYSDTGTSTSFVTTEVDFKVEIEKGSTAGATSVYSKFGETYSAEDAFIGTDYWSSIKNPSTPVILWFKFISSKRIVSFSFEKIETTRSPQTAADYEFFGSNYASCDDVTQHVNIHRTFEGSSGTQWDQYSQVGSSGTSDTVVDASFTNYLKYRCYGFKISKIYQEEAFASLKNIQFWEAGDDGKNMI
jgi:hypothetical protein